MERPNLENYKLGKGIRINDFVSDLILYIDQSESQLKERDELLQRIFDYHISYGFGDDGSFESFADEITELEECANGNN